MRRPYSLYLGPASLDHFRAECDVDISFLLSTYSLFFYFDTRNPMLLKAFGFETYAGCYAEIGGGIAAPTKR